MNARRRQCEMLGSSTAPERVGKVRVAVVGDTGSGKTSWVHLIRANGAHGGSRGAGAASVREPQERTMGCKPEVTMVWFDEVRTTGGANPSRPYFVEMWDVGGHHEWKNLRAAFYADLDGVVLVHDLTRRRTLGRLARWAREIAASASFASRTPAGSETDARDAMVAAVGGKLLGDALDGCVVHGFCGLPVPALFVGNKADIVRDASSSRDEEDASTPGEILSALLWRAWVAIAARLRLPKAWRGGANGTPGGHERSGSFATLLPTTVQELKRVSSGVFGEGGLAGPAGRAAVLGVVAPAERWAAVQRHARGRGHDGGGGVLPRAHPPKALRASGRHGVVVGGGAAAAGSIFRRRRRRRGGITAVGRGSGGPGRGRRRSRRGRSGWAATG